MRQLQACHRACEERELRGNAQDEIATTPRPGACPDIVLSRPDRALALTARAKWPPLDSGSGRGPPPPLFLQGNAPAWLARRGSDGIPPGALQRIGPRLESSEEARILLPDQRVALALLPRRAGTEDREEQGRAAHLCTRLRNRLPHPGSSPSSSLVTPSDLSSASVSGAIVCSAVRAAALAYAAVSFLHLEATTDCRQILSYRDRTRYLAIRS